jgi:hypothetical protein
VLAFLLLVAFSAPAWAGKTVLIPLGTAPCATTTAVGISEAEMRRVAVYRTLGMDLDIKRIHTVKTEWVRQLVFPGVGGTGTQSYVAAIMPEFGANTNAQGASCPCVPCSLTFLDRWMVGGPLILTPPQSHSAGGMLEQVAACSTGFQANAAAVLTKFEVNRFVPGTSYMWRAYNMFDSYRKIATNPPANGVFRVLVGESHNGWNPYAQQSLAPSDIDSLPDGAQTSDTVASVARYKKNGGGPPIVISGLGVGANTNSDYGTLLQSLAFADSAAGRAMLGQTRPLPVRFNIQVGPLAATGQFNTGSAGGLDEGIGPYPGDSVYVKATLSGYHVMRMKGTVLLQTHADTVSAFANQYEWVRLLWPEAHVAPFNKAGVWTTAQGGKQGADTPTRSHDALGATRERSLFPAGCTDPRAGCNCGSDTTSVYCHLTRDFGFLERYFGKARVDHIIAAPLEDWTPFYFTRSRGSLDSLKWCFYLAGVRGVRVGNYSLLNDVGTATGATNPRGYRSGFSVENVRDPASGQVIGQLAFMPSRDWDLDPSSAIPAHDIAEEFMDGLLAGDWYTASRSAQYVNGHNFFARTVVFEIPGNALGGNGTALGNHRKGYWFAKSLWSMCKATNRFGRTVIEPSYGEETVDWMIRSGLR